MLGLLNNTRHLQAAERVREKTYHWPWELLQPENQPPSWSGPLVEELSAFARERSRDTDDRGDITAFRDYLTRFIQERIDNNTRTRSPPDVRLKVADIRRARQAWESGDRPSGSKAPPINPISSPVSSSPARSASSSASGWSESDIANAGFRIRPKPTSPDPAMRTKYSLPATNRATPVVNTESSSPVPDSTKPSQAPTAPPATTHAKLGDKNKRIRTCNDDSPKPLSPSDLTELYSGPSSVDMTSRKSSAETGSPATTGPGPVALPPQLPSVSSSYGPPPTGIANAHTTTRGRPLKRRRHMDSVGDSIKRVDGLVATIPTPATTSDESAGRYDSPIREASERLQGVAADIAANSKLDYDMATEALQSATDLEATASKELEKFQTDALQLDTELQTAKEEFESSERSAKKAHEALVLLESLLNPEVSGEKAILMARRAEAATTAKAREVATSKLKELEQRHSRQQTITKQHLKEHHRQAAKLVGECQLKLGKLVNERHALDLYYGLVKLRPAGLLHMLTLTNLLYSFEAGLSKYRDDFGEDGSGETKRSAPNKSSAP